MRKKNFEIRISLHQLIKAKGFIASIKTPGNFKFGVSELNGQWRTTELSTGFAVPDSYADNAEDSVKKARLSIDSINTDKTYFQGIVTGIKQILKLAKKIKENG